MRSAPLRRVAFRKSSVVVLAAGIWIQLACYSEVRDDEVTSSREAPSQEALEISERLTDPRPSVVVVVLDTVRADAVSSYGFVVGTTPHLDALAAEGIRYEHAYAPAPWTAASHASLFTGLRVDQHGVGLDGRTVVQDSLQMLAEDFRDAGYTTASFAENALIDERFGFDQGFDRFESPDLLQFVKAEVGGTSFEPFDLIRGVRDWNRQRDKSRPYFLFVNLFDAHDPYVVRDENPWVPKGLPREEVDYIASKYLVPQALCDALPIPKHLAILRGLYLGDVAAADGKLGEIMRILEAGDEKVPRLVVATSDHGEHLGENRLMGHQFSVRNAALQIPLIVTGLKETPPAVIEAPVELRSVHSALLCWALGRGCPAELPAAATGSNAKDTTDSNPIFSIYSDTIVPMPQWLLESFEMTRDQEIPSQARASCRAEDQVFGEMVSMIRYPMKAIWFSRNDVVLHDLRWDAAERADQMRRQPELAASLRAELETFVRENVTSRDPSAVPELSDEARRTLEALGYVH